MQKTYMIVDTETTQDSTVADFAAVVVNSKGEVLNQCAVIIPHELKKGLFFDPTNASFWTKQYAEKKAASYQEMMLNGSRMAATVPAVNRWLAKALAQYNPILTAYNLAFDIDKCRNTGIDLDIFDNRRFCLWYATNAMLIRGANAKPMKKFIDHCIAHYYITPKFNIRTNAECIAHYVTGENNSEPHTALEDVLYFELPILKAILRRKKCIVERGYNWREFQLKDLAQGK